MREKLFFMLMLMIMSMGGFAQNETTITIGNGTTTTYYLPFGNWWKNSWTQMIYPASAITDPGIITSIGFHVSDVPASPMQFNDLHIYLGTTQSLTHANSSSWLPLADLTEVFSATNGPLPADTGWLTIPLDNPFPYDGIDNLVIVISKKMDNYTSSLKFHYTSTTDAALYRGSDSDQSYADHPGNATGTKSSYLPNLQLTIAPMSSDFCYAVKNLSTTSVTSTEATLTWQSSISAINYVVQYKEANQPWDENAFEVITSDTTVDLYALTTSTAYNVRVASLCGSGDTSVWRSITFTTSCEEITELPLSVDFDDVAGTTSGTTNNLPICWNYLNNGTSSTYAGYPIVYNSSTYAFSGSNSLRFYTYSTAGTYDDQIAILPPIDVTMYPINTLQVSFGAIRYSTYTLTIVVGVMTNPGDKTTFVPVDTITTSSNTYGFYEIQLSDYEGTGNYIALMAPQPTSSYNAGCLDNIEVNLIPACTRPSSLAMVSSTETSATLTWESTASLFTLHYKMASDTEFTDVENISLDADNTYTLDNLTASSIYEWYVTALCDDGTEISSFGTGNFNTECGVVTEFPWSEGFEESWVAVSAFDQNNPAPNCWKIYDGGATSSSYDWKWRYNTTAGRVYEGNSSAACYTDYATAAHNDWLVSPLLQLDGNKMLSFYAQRATASTSEPDEISIWISDEDAVLTAPDSSDAPLPGFTELFQTDIPAGAFQLYEVSLANYTGNRYIAFVRRNEPYNGYWLALDNVTVADIPECAAPNTLVASGITSNSANLSWAGNVTSYNLYYRVVGDTAYTMVDNVSLGEDGYLLSGLESATGYEWYVTSICPDGTEVPSNSTGSFVTGCEMITQLPYTWDFEARNPITTLPLCWSALNLTADTKVNLNSSDSYHGSGHLYLYHTSPLTTLVLPEFDANTYPVNTLQLTFFAKDLGTYDTWDVSVKGGVMTDPEDASTFEQVDSISVVGAAGGQYEQYTLNFGDYTGEGQYIAIRFQRNNGSYWLRVDDMTLEVAPLCSQPTDLAMVSSSTSSATLTWNSDASSYTLYYKAVSDNNYTAVENVMLDADSTYTLTDLPASSNFDWYVAANCDDGSVATSTFSTFNTACDIVTELPWSEGFESDWIPVSAFDQNNDAPNCWKVYNGGATSTSYNWNWRHNTTAGRVYEGSGSAACYTDYATSNHNDWLVTPLIQLDGNQMVSFYAQRATATTSEPDEISIWISDEDAELAAPASTVDPLPGFTELFQTDIPAGAFQQYEVSLAGYSGNRYIAFVRRNAPNDGYYLALDNVVVSDMPDCMKPVGLSVARLDATEADLTWNSNASSFDLYYKASSDNEWIQESGVTLDENGVYTLSNLTPSTTYLWYVEAVCADSNLTSNEATFTTPCTGLDSVPYTWNFDGNNPGGTASYPLPECWSRISTSTSTLYPYVYSSSSNAHSGSYVLYFYNSYANSYAILPNLDNSVIDIHDLQLSFYAKASSTSGNPALEVGVMTDPNNASTFTLVQSIPLTTSHPTDAYTVVFTNYTGENGFIALRNVVTSSAYNYVYIDDVTLEERPSCVKPIELEATSATTSSVTLMWTAQGEETEWEIAYGLPGFDPDSTTDVVTAYSVPFEVSGLNTSTFYQFYVRAICDGFDQSAWSAPKQASTACDLIDLPYTENFNAYTTTATTSAPSNYPDDIMPLCWTFLNRSTSSSTYPIAYVSSSSTYAVSGNCLFFKSSSTTPIYAVLPAFTDALNTAQITFTYRNEGVSTYNGTLSLGYMTDNMDANTFVELATYPQTTIHTEITEVLNSLPDSAAYLAFKYTGGSNNNYYLGLDNIYVEIIPTCPRPTDLSVTGATTSSVTLTWEAGDETAWEVVYGAPGFDVETATPIAANSNPFTVTNLNASTSYEFYVRALCTATDYSTWSEPITYNTNCEAFTAPYSENFDSYAASSTSTTTPSNYPNTIMPNCWSFLNCSTVSGSYPQAFLTSSSSYAVSGNCLFFKSSSSTPLYAILPEFTDDIQTLSLYFTYRNEGTTSSNGTLSVGYMTNPSDATTFTEVSTFPQISSLTADTVDFSNVPSTVSNAYIVFKYTGGTNNNYYLSLDNISVVVNGAGPVITDPTVATTAATSITQTGATLNGTITNPDNVAITAKGFEWKATAGGTYAPVTVTGNNLTYNLTGLTANTGYTYKAFITFNGQTVYGSEMTFTTLPEDVQPCDVPTNLHTTDIQNESISITWNSNANVNSWNVQYRPAAGGQWTQVTVNTNSYTITNLTGKTNYEIQVQANCGDGNLSDWSASITAQTTDVGIVNFLENSITLFPNPANDVVNVQCTMFQVQFIEVIDVYGKLINTVNVVDNPARINVSGLANGVYFVRVTTEEGVVTKQFVKR